MSTDLIKATPNVELQAQKTLEWLGEIQANIKKVIQDDPKEGVRLIKAVEVLEIMATKLRTDQLVQQAMVTHAKLSRELGLFLRKNLQGKGRPGKCPSPDIYSLKDLNVERQRAAEWEKIADLPEFAFEHALKAVAMPSINYLLRECARYEKLKSVVKKAELRDGPAKVKEFVLAGYTPAEAKAEIDPPPGESIDDIFPDDEDETVDISEVPVHREVVDLHTNMPVIVELILKAAKAYDKAAGFTEEYFALTVDDQAALVEAIKILRESPKKNKPKMRENTAA